MDKRRGGRPRAEGSREHLHAEEGADQGPDERQVGEPRDGEGKGKAERDG